MERAPLEETGCQWFQGFKVHSINIFTIQNLVTKLSQASRKL